MKLVQAIAAPLLSVGGGCRWVRIEGGRLMNLPERPVIEDLDEVIRRSTLRLEQEQLHVSMLQEGGNQQNFAKAALERQTAALGRLKAYRARFLD